MNKNGIELLKITVPEDKDYLIDEQVKAFADIVGNMTTLYAKKNHDYGNAFGEIIAEVGLPYGVGKLKEKLKRIETLINSKAEVNESLEDSLIDLSCYTIMTLSYLKRKNNK